MEKYCYSVLFYCKSGDSSFVHPIQGVRKQVEEYASTLAEKYDSVVAVYQNSVLITALSPFIVKALKNDKKEEK